MHIACAFDLVLLARLFCRVSLYEALFLSYPSFLLHWPMIILRHHLMTKGVHKTLSYVYAHCLRILFDLVLRPLLRVCLYMRLFNRIMHYLCVYVHEKWHYGMIIANDYTLTTSNERGRNQDLIICPCTLLAHLIWSCLRPCFVVCLHMRHWPMIKMYEAVLELPLLFCFTGR